MSAIRFLIFTLLVSAAVTSAKTKFEQIHGFEPHFVLPPDAGMANIKTDFGAKGDGRSDDTKAFQEALHNNAPRAIYIPAGTYLIKDQLRYGVSSNKKKRTLLIGESRSSTVLRLADTTLGFANADTPRVFIHTRPKKQQAEQNMHHYIYHLTIEIGKGNPGAIALNFHTNNSGAIKDITIRSSHPNKSPGFRGLAFDDFWFGPGSAFFVEIDGFKEGVYLGSAHNHVVMEHFTIVNCETGVRNKGNTCSLRDVTTNNCRLAIKNEVDHAHMVLVHSHLTEGPKKGPAIVNEGALLSYGIKTSGYTSAIKSSSPAGNLKGNDIHHYTSHAPRSLWGNDTKKRESLQLKVAESPEYQYPQSAKAWAVTPAKGDITQAIQAAIDSGKTTIYIPHGGGKEITADIYLRNKLQRIMGLSVATIGGRGRLIIEDGDADAVIAELIYSRKYRHRSSRTFVLRHSGGAYETDSAGFGAGVFMESVVGSEFRFRRVSAWLRDMNTEVGGEGIDENILNDGSTIWILGQKTEDYATKLATINGGKTELLGGAYRQNWNEGDNVEQYFDTTPLFYVKDAKASFSFKTFSNGKWSPNYKYLVFDIRKQKTKKLSHEKAGGVIALYTTY
ncbi:MAG: hypothetical protein GF398_01550 [Chitinivibrionales bacterium]|nr:hypothetical protein [Chitinivibrionales bacterium]